MKKYNFEFVRTKREDIFDICGNFRYNIDYNDSEVEHIFKNFSAKCEEEANNKAYKWCFKNQCFDYRMI